MGGVCSSLSLKGFNFAHSSYVARGPSSAICPVYLSVRRSSIAYAFFWPTVNPFPCIIQSERTSPDRFLTGEGERKEVHAIKGNPAPRTTLPRKKGIWPGDRQARNFLRWKKEEGGRPGKEGSFLFIVTEFSPFHLSLSLCLVAAHSF